MPPPPRVHGCKLNLAIETMRLADACELLAIRTDTSREDAQRAYRKLALRHHPDRCPNDPSATSRFQTVGEAWERVQQFHDNPRRWGLHADPPEPQAESAAAQATDFAGGRATSFDDLFERWFGGRTTWGEGDFAPPAPRVHKAGCACDACARERRREAIFEQRTLEREAKRRRAAAMLNAAQERAKEEAARTVRRTVEDEAARRRSQTQTAQRAAARRRESAAALERRLDCIPSLFSGLTALG